LSPGSPYHGPKKPGCRRFSTETNIRTLFDAPQAVEQHKPPPRPDAASITPRRGKDKTALLKRNSCADTTGILLLFFSK
jgi:hypothetical protein